MSRWDDEFNNHALWKTVEEAQKFLEVVPNEIDADHEVEKRRLTK